MRHGMPSHSENTQASHRGTTRLNRPVFVPPPETGPAEAGILPGGARSVPESSLSTSGNRARCSGQPPQRVEETPKSTSLTKTHSTGPDSGPVESSSLEGTNSTVNCLPVNTDSDSQFGGHLGGPVGSPVPKPPKVQREDRPGPVCLAAPGTCPKPQIGTGTIASQKSTG